MSKFKTPNPGRFKRQDESMTLSGFTMYLSLCIAVGCLGGIYFGDALYSILKSLGFFAT